MGAREFQNILKKIRNRCEKFGVEGIYLSKIENELFKIHSARWNDSIELEMNILEPLFNVGHLKLSGNRQIITLAKDDAEKNNY